MEMHDLQQAWNRLDARVEEQQAELTQLRQRTGLGKVQARLRRMAVGPLLQLAVGVMVMLWAGGYWTEHMVQTHLLLSGIALHLYGIGLAVAAAWQLALVARIDYEAPVLEVQRLLLRLRQVRINAERALLLAGFVVWLPLVLVVSAMAGVDLFLARPVNVYANLGVAALLVIVVYGLQRRFRPTFERGAAGRALREAQAELDALSSNLGDDR